MVLFLNVVIIRKKLSTETVIYALLNNILLSMERRNFVGGLFCDLQKAFDRVNHEILLEKMKLYGISGTANKLMESYFENRYQRVSVNNIKPHRLYSKWIHVTHGILQSSVLGPLLFLIYINKHWQISQPHTVCWWYYHYYI